MFPQGVDIDRMARAPQDLDSNSFSFIPLKFHSTINFIWNDSIARIELETTQQKVLSVK